MPVLLPVWKRLCTQHTGFHALLAGFLPFCRYVCPALGLGRPFGELCKEGGPNSEEVQLLVGLVLLGIYKTWKCPTAEERTGLVLLYGKFLSVYLLFQGGSWSALVLYLLNWLLVYVLIQPARYWGPVKAFPLTADGVERAVRLTTVAQAEGGGRQAKQQRRKLDEADQSFMAEAWVILFETKWAPAARYFTVPFAELANTYTSSRLHFGRVDLDAYPALKQKYGIATDAASLDIPTVILFRQGKEMLRLPSKETGKVWDRSTASVVEAFHLEEYLDGTTQ